MVRSEGNMSLKNPVTPPGIDPGTVRLVAQRLNHYTTPGPLMCSDSLKMIKIDRSMSELLQILWKKKYNFNSSAFVGFIV
jgi:hypothetical protein